MTRLILSLALRALVLAMLIGIVLSAAAPAFSDTEARLKVFVQELDRAGRELKAPRPESVMVLSFEDAMKFPVSPLAAAFLLPGVNGKGRVRVAVVWAHLMGASDARLRCWARHEMTHVYLGHVYGARDQREADRHHDIVRAFMNGKWRQDSSCLVP
jgi:hypothetical protein